VYSKDTRPCSDVSGEQVRFGAIALKN
jgi:hypothetical protein